MINFYRRPESHALALQVKDILIKKCNFKEISIPSYTDLQEHRETCLAGWNSQLAHQLQALPPFESFWGELPAFFNWLNGIKTQLTPLMPILPSSADMSEGAINFNEDNNQLELSSLGPIRFSAANRLCVEIEYTRDDGEHEIYLIEPYSLRRSSSNDLLLYALQHPRREIKSFRISQISSAKITSQTFEPFYQIEFLPTGPRYQN